MSHKRGCGNSRDRICGFGFLNGGFKSITHMSQEKEIIVGGQGVIEGVMMRAPNSYAVAVRRQDGTIVSKSERLPKLSEKYPILRVPILRGGAVLIHSMVLGLKAINFSASVAFEDLEAQTAAERKQSEPRPAVQAATA